MEISKIQVEEFEYDIKDATARDHLLNKLDKKEVITVENNVGVMIPNKVYCASASGTNLNITIEGFENWTNDGVYYDEFIIVGNVNDTSSNTVESVPLLIPETISIEWVNGTAPSIPNGHWFELSIVRITKPDSTLYKGVISTFKPVEV